jgi:hypothetical protein
LFIWGKGGGGVREWWKKGRVRKETGRRRVRGDRVVKEERRGRVRERDGGKAREERGERR